MPQVTSSSRPAELPKIAARLLLRPEEGAEILNVSRARMYELMAAGKVRSIKVGRLRRIPVHEIERFIATELEAQCA